MKTTNLILAGLMMIGLTACGNQNTNPYMGAYGYNGYGTQTGYNGYGGVTQGGCVPVQSGAFGFTAQGAQMNGAVILAGTLPMNSTRPGVYGQVTMGSNTGVNQGMIQYQPKMGQMGGQMQISVAPQGGVLTGMIQLPQQIVYQLMALGGYNQYYPQQNTQSQMCVASIAVDIVHTLNISNGAFIPQYGGSMGMGYINQALVYLTLGTGQTVGPIAF